MRYQTLLSLAGLALLDVSLARSISKRTDVQGYNYLGCFYDSPQNRQLTGAQYYDSNGMTVESCVAFCDSKGYSTAGLEYGQECYCGYQFHNQPLQEPESDCSMSCVGDSTEVCGAGNRLSVYTNGKSAPVTNPGTNGYTLLGCYTDNVSARSLSVGMNGGGTVAGCIATCKAAGYAYAGVEYSSECYCDSGIRNDASIEPAGTGCDMVCSNDASQYCGGAGSIDIYYAYNSTSSRL